MDSVNERKNEFFGLLRWEVTLTNKYLKRRIFELFGAALLLNRVVASQGFSFKEGKKSFSQSPWMKVANKMFPFSRPDLHVLKIMQIS